MDKDERLDGEQRYLESEKELKVPPKGGWDCIQLLYLESEKELKGLGAESWEVASHEAWNPRRN